MKNKLYNISIRNKLILAIQSVTITVLVVSFVSYFIFTSSRDKENLIQRMEITAKLVGEYAVSPLVFGDEIGGKDILSRLESMPEVVSGYILDENGKLFASYGIDTVSNESGLNPSDLKINTELDFSIWQDNYFTINREINYDNTYYGKISLIISLKPFKDKLISDLKILSINMFFIFIVSWLLSLFIQQYISKPINKLVRTTNRIVQEGDYNLRVHNQGNDEIGQLYDSYNKMLERITLEQEQQEKYLKALEISESNYRSIFENSIVGIFNIDLKTGEILQANDRFYEILRLDKSEIRKFTIDEFVSKGQKTEFLHNIQEEGQIENYEIEYKKGIWISFSGNVIQNFGLIDGVIQDITERKENMIQLNKVNFELDNFVYHASHDLRSPLRSILGLTNLLKYNLEIADNIQLVEKIENSINRLDLLVTDLLTFSKNNRTASDEIEINIKELISECVENLSLEYQKGVNIGIQINQKCNFVGDKTRLSVIINNLLVNACKYQRVEEPQKRVNIEVKITQKYLQMEISDNGEGISEHDQGKIFDMFYRASESSEGSGLGLYIVKNVIETLNGQIFISSELHKGTSFKFRLPNLLPELE